MPPAFTLRFDPHPPCPACGAQWGVATPDCVQCLATILAMYHLADFTFWQTVQQPQPDEVELFLAV